MSENLYLEGWLLWMGGASLQLALLIIAIALVAALASRLSARWRYALWTLVLVKAMLPPSLGHEWSIGAFVEPEVSPYLESASISDRAVADQDVYTRLEDMPELSASASASSATPPPQATQQATAIAGVSTGMVLFVVWLAGFSAYILLLGYKYIRLKMSLRRAADVDEGPLRIELEQLAMEMGRRNPPRLLLSESISSPFLIGVFRPRIVLPMDIREQLSADELRMVLRHELVHWVRWDVAACWLQTLVLAVFWFHPLVWYACAQMRHERERAVDEALLAMKAVAPRSYGEALLKVVLMARGHSTAGLGYLGVFERTRKLENRLEGIMNFRPMGRRAGAFAWIALVLLAGLLLPMGSGADAQQATATAADQAPATTIAIQHDDGVSDGRQSYGGPVGHLVRFTTPKPGHVLQGIEIYGSRYGTPEPPNEDFAVGIFDGNREPVTKVDVPYSKLERGDPRWYYLSLDGIELPKDFWVGVYFRAHQTKGFYMHYDTTAPTGNSMKGWGGEWEPVEQNWMIRAYISPPGSAPVATPVNPNAPRVVSITPPNGANNVNPNTSEVVVIFDRPMDTTGYSWIDIGNYPDQPEGKQTYWRDERTAVKPVYLQPGRTYRMQLNNEQYQAFKSKEGVPVSPTAFSFTTAGVPGGAAGPPRIVSTTPEIGATDVDPNLDKIVVVFDRPMDTRGYSWTGGGEPFPKIPEGQRPEWVNETTCVLPVELVPGHVYRLGINSTSHRNFKAKDGVPVKPVVLTFTTAGGDPSAIATPRIVEMIPANGATDVDPALKEVRVTFDMPMGGGFSWCGGGETFPTITEGQRPYWTNDDRTAVLPVSLKPNWQYHLSINCPSAINFQSAAGVPAQVTPYSFRTR